MDKIRNFISTKVLRRRGYRLAEEDVENNNINGGGPAGPADASKKQEANPHALRMFISLHFVFVRLPYPIYIRMRIT